MRAKYGNVYKDSNKASFTIKLAATPTPAPFSLKIINPTMGSMAKLNSKLQWIPVNGKQIVKYDVYFGTKSSSMQMVRLSYTQEYLYVYNMKQNQTYYWRIVGKDALNRKFVTPIYNFKASYYAKNVKEAMDETLFIIDDEMTGAEMLDASEIETISEDLVETGEDLSNSSGCNINNSAWIFLLLVPIFALTNKK